MGKTYYNENNPKMAAWLRALIKEGLISDGDVDDRSIAEVQPADLVGYRRCHFFAGIGGWDYALQLAGWPDDAEVWTGSCPCQPFSSAGKRKGTADERHLWPEFRRLIEARQPSVAFGEQVASNDGREWLAGVFADLEVMGYQRAGADLCAAGVGSPHIRQRIYWVADSEQVGEEAYTQAGIAVDGDETATRVRATWQGSGWSDYSEWNMQDARRRCERGTLPLANGLSERMDDIGGYGNAIVPQVAAQFVRAYMESVGMVAEA